MEHATQDRPSVIEEVMEEEIESIPETAHYTGVRRTTTLGEKLRYITPPSILRNLYINWKINGKLDKNRLMLMSPKVEVSMAKTAKITMKPGSRMNFGYFTHQAIQTVPAILRMSEDSELIINEGRNGVQTGGVIVIANGAKVNLGSDFKMASNARIVAYTDVNIGENCMIGWEAQILCGDGHPLYRDGKCINPPQPITIGDNVWIGARATILKGVTIGSGSIIGINAIVFRDVPENSVVFGNPARVVQTGVNWQR